MLMERWNNISDNNWSTNIGTLAVPQVDNPKASPFINMKGGVLDPQGVRASGTQTFPVNTGPIDPLPFKEAESPLLDDNPLRFYDNSAIKGVPVDSSTYGLEITLEKGLLILSGILSGSKSYGKEKLAFIPRISDNNGAKLKNEYSFPQEDLSWKKEIDEFADCIKNNKAIYNGNLQDSIKVMELIEKIYLEDKQWYKDYVK